MLKLAQCGRGVSARFAYTVLFRSAVSRRVLSACVLLTTLPVIVTAQNVAGDPSLFDDPGASSYFDENAKRASLKKLPLEERPYAVDLGSRTVVFSKSTRITFNGTRQRAYVQFERPLSAAERGKVTRLGVTFHQALGNGAYLITLTEGAYKALQADPLFRGFGDIKHVDKLTRELYQASIPSHAKTADGRIAVNVRFLSNVALEQALALLDENDARVGDRSRYLLNNRIRVEATLAAIQKIAESPLVAEIAVVPAPPKDDNVDAAAMSNIDVLQQPPFNLLGTNVNMGHWEGGQVLDTHADMAGRVTRVEIGTYGDHATHVAGTMIGDGSNNALARGMAPAANLFSWINNGDVPTEMADGVTNQQISTANHSWGISTNGSLEPDQSIFGVYDVSAQGWDTAIATSGLIVCNSSGNDNVDNDGVTFEGVTGTDGLQYHTIDSAGSAKNNITVGNLSDDGVNIRPSSSTGPCDDGRIKPDVVANGQSLLSTSYDGNAMNITFYENMSGTSMATPTVAGACALLVERWRQNNSNANPWAETIKAIIIHTATDLGIAGPDNIYGYGLVNASAALDVLDTAAVRVITEAVDVLQTNEYKVPVPPGTAELRVTLVWTDPAGALNANPALVNDLNLELEGPDGVVRFPFTGASAGVGPTAGTVASPATTTGPNNIDTVEQVLVAAPVQGFWKARVIGGTGVQIGPQNYALITNIGFQLPGNPQISANAPLDFDEICIGKKQDIRVSIFNTGGAPLDVNSASITAGVENFSVLPNPVQPYSIAPGSHIDITVRYTPSSVGPHNGILTLTSNDPLNPTLNFEITGEGGTGDARVTLPNNGNYGDGCAGSYKDLSLTISNNGTCPLRVTGVASDSDQFIVPEGPGTIDPVSPVVIAPGDSFQVPVRFQPTLPFGAKSGNITVLTDDPDAAQATIVRNVTGNYPPPVIDINACPIEFGEACLGDPASLTKVVNICNTGLCPLTIPANGIRFQPATAEFAIVTAPTYPLTISPGSECYPVTIRFTPTSPGPKSATLVVEGVGGLIRECEVTGTTEDLEPALQFPARLAFEPTVIEDNAPCSSFQPLALQNIGNRCGLTISALEITGDDADQFELVGLPSSSAFPVTIAPGETLGDGALKVRFKPRKLTTKRFLSANVEVTYVINPQVVPPTTVTHVIPMAGEATQSGLRCRVMVNGTPVDIVKQLKIQRRGGKALQMKNVLQKAVTGPPGFEDVLSFHYHAETGGLSAPNQSLTGDFRVTAKVTIGKRTLTRSVNLSIKSCDFNDEMVINF